LAAFPSHLVVNLYAGLQICHQ